MKTITLWQPYASCIAWGLKKIETRSWQTLYRGALAIHSAMRKPDFSILYDQSIQAAIDALDMKYPLDLPLGYIIATCVLVDCAKIHFEYMQGTKGEYPVPHGVERALGNYTPGRYAWILNHITPVNPPIKARGARMLWEWIIQ